MKNKMPFKKKYVKKYRKSPRTYRRKRYVKKTGATPRSVIPINGFPNSMLVRMKYVQSVVLNPDGIAPVLYQFRCNSIYDPDYTGTGHQPRSSDEFAQIYKHYNVISSKITVRCNPSTSTNTVPCVWGVVQTTAPADLVGLTRDSIIETCKSSINRYKVAGGDASFGNGGNLTQKAYWSARKEYGLKKGQVATYQPNSADFGASPTRSPVFTIWCDHSALNDPNPQEWTVQIDYLVLLTERYLLNAS